jgi:glutamine amidotransferase-like uncharacterized protein
MEPAGSTVVAKYVDGPMKGLAAIVESTMGKGKVVVLGTMPEAKALVVSLQGQGRDGRRRRRGQHR